MKYRGHVIVLEKGAAITAVIVECGTDAILPTKVTVPQNDGEAACLAKAKELVDLYVDPRTPQPI